MTRRWRDSLIVECRHCGNPFDALAPVQHETNCIARPKHTSIQPERAEDWEAIKQHR